MTKFKIYKNQHSYLRISKDTVFCTLIPHSFKICTMRSEELETYSKVKYFAVIFLKWRFELVLRNKKNIITEDYWFNKTSKSYEFKNSEEAETFFQQKTLRSNV